MTRLPTYLALFVLPLLMVPYTLAEPVLTTSGDIRVSQEDLERYIKENIPAAKRDRVLERPGIYRQMAENIYIVRTLAAEAEAQTDFDRAQAVWAAQMKYLRRLVEDYRVEYVKRNVEDVDWQALAREKYLAEADRFISEEKVRASHILIATDERADEEALQLASKLRQRLIAGEEFAALAIEYSDDPAGKQNGGDLGFFGRKKMVEPFSDAVFVMQEKGDISEIVKTPFGYHIILFVERKPAEPIPFADVKDQIVDEIQTQSSSQIWQDKIIAVRSAPDIQYNEQLLQQMKEDNKRTAESN